MGVLHLFGDSFTEGHILDKTYPAYKEWKLYRGGELPLCWGDLLSKKLNMVMKNHAVAGMSNSEIFQSICRHSHTFEKDDIVIINWTYPNRFRWVYWCKHHKKYKWVRLSLNPEDESKILEETRNELQEFINTYNTNKKLIDTRFGNYNIEIVTEQIVDGLATTQKAGVRIAYASDSTLATYRVTR